MAFKNCGRKHIFCVVISLHSLKFSWNSFQVKAPFSPGYYTSIASVTLPIEPSYAGSSVLFQIDSCEEEHRMTLPRICSLWEGRLSRVAKKDGDEKGEPCL